MSTLTSKLEQANFKLNNLAYKLLKLQQEVRHLHTREADSTIKEADVTVEVEFLRGKVEHVDEKAKGKGIQASFKVFCQLILQLHLDFNIKAIEALVTLVVVD